MNNSELLELLLARLYELAEKEGHGKYFSLNTIAADLGVEDKGKVLNVARLLGDRGLIHATHTHSGSSGFISGEGAVLVEEGGRTGVIDSYRADPDRWLKLKGSQVGQKAMPNQLEPTGHRLSDLVSSVLEADFAERRRAFVALLDNVLDQFEAKNMLGSSSMIAALRDAASSELRLRSDLVFDTWARVIRAYPAEASRSIADEITRTAASQLSGEHRDVQSVANSKAAAQGPLAVSLDKDYELQKRKLEANLLLLTMGATTNLALETARSPASLPLEVFIVHGHDDAVKEAVARFLEKAGLRPIILHEQPSRGRTIIEKLEDFANTGFAVILLTPDDVGRAKEDTQEMARARQNVIFEMGYFLALLGRHRVCALYQSVEIPSDIAGVIYIAIDHAGAWKAELAKELSAAGYGIDLPRALGLGA